MKNKRKVLFLLCMVFIVTILYSVYNKINKTGEVSTLFVVKEDNKYVIINENEKNILKSYYHFIDSNYDGYARVMQFTKWGFIDKKGTVRIPIKYDYALSFSEGYAVKSRGRFCWLDHFQIYDNINLEVTFYAKKSKREERKR
ncbi:virus A13L protein [Anaerovirgula multivorans]|uniref:Virus A13L protein n=1 Tax=Anaerovirgula multivorans TaxID=312168 RepID=A0A239KVT8_9FIRM|nr:WG repeat-containing protein [Anaerovirgula multivorans]SNT21862.1 virus A13L protein [Anaerovirgula multivorans]